MKKSLVVSTFIFAIIAIFLYSCQMQEGSAAPAASNIDKDSLIRKGAYLVTIMGCNDCHTRKTFGPQGVMLDSSHYLSGHLAEDLLAKMDTSTANHWILAAFDATAFHGPWGTSFAANLTPDPTGLGGWTRERFSKALREGQLQGIDGTRKLLPPMAWPNYTHLKDEDLAALWAYLQSIKPVKNLVQQPIPPAGTAK